MKTIKIPVGNHIFKVENACIKLREGDKIIFHRLVAKLLLLRKRARSDIQTKNGFLVTRVRNPDEDDWKKLRMVLSYLDAKINTVKIHFNKNYLNVFHWWLDASHGTHTDIK